MHYCFDLDETLCLTPNSRNYAEATPIHKMIDEVNKLYDLKNNISIFTARGSSSKKDYRELTESQLLKWGVKYHSLILGKPGYDLLIDDKAINTTEWRKSKNISIVGFVASAFDLLHAGHCLYLKDAKSKCDVLIAGLHTDPSIERIDKNKPIQSLEERMIQLKSCKFIDEIYTYNTENELESLLKTINPDIRILGSDCKNKPITGEVYCKSIYYHERNHNWSSSLFRERILNDR